MPRPPLPSADLAYRVGPLQHEQALAAFDEIGLGQREHILRLLPAGWLDTERRVLDFGCGSGKTLRHFIAEAERGEFYGCDIHEPSIRWLDENLSPPLHVFVCGELPPLPLPDDHLDLVWALSVFTHLTDSWADWLLELRRVLRPGGRLIASYLGAGMSAQIAGEPWQPDRIGMNVLRAWESWDQGGPLVQHSEWWLREHWGRGFKVERVEDGPDRQRHGLIVLVKPEDEPPSRAALVATGADPREVAALSHNVRQLQREAASIHADRVALAADRDAAIAHRDALAVDRDAVVAERDALAARRDAVVAERDALVARLDVIVQSRSWRLARLLAGLVRSSRRVARVLTDVLPERHLERQD